MKGYSACFIRINSEPRQIWSEKQSEVHIRALPFFKK